MSEMTCPKCEGMMEEDYVFDQAYGTAVVSSWVEGVPEKSLWSGLHTKNRRKLPITVYRCTACGYLEFYARGERKKKKD